MRRLCKRASIADTVLMLTLAVSVGGMAAAASAQQAKKANDAAAVKTALGDPSFEGLWGSAYFIPLERDPKYGTREMLTEAERAAIAKAASMPRPRKEAPTREIGSEQHVQGGYFDLAPPAPSGGGPRPVAPYTSLVIDPPDGRIPPYTPEKQRQARIQREFEVMLLQASSACKTKQPECDGGTYGPVSPRYYDVPSYYVAQSYYAGGLNRALGPEDMASNG
jgi:hypothetical protein